MDNYLNKTSIIAFKINFQLCQYFSRMTAVCDKVIWPCFVYVMCFCVSEQVKVMSARQNNRAQPFSEYQLGMGSQNIGKQQKKILTTKSTALFVPNWFDLMETLRESSASEFSLIVATTPPLSMGFHEKTNAKGHCQVARGFSSFPSPPMVLSQRVAKRPWKTFRTKNGGSACLCINKFVFSKPLLRSLLYCFVRVRLKFTTFPSGVPCHAMPSLVCSFSDQWHCFLWMWRGLQLGMLRRDYGSYSSFIRRGHYIPWLRLRGYWPLGSAAAKWVMVPRLASFVRVKDERGIAAWRAHPSCRIVCSWFDALFAETFLFTACTSPKFSCVCWM